MSAGYNEKTHGQAGPIDEKSSPTRTSYDNKAQVSHVDRTVAETNARLANPLEGIPQAQVMEDAARFAREHGLGHLEDEFRKGALVAQDPSAFESLSQLSEADKEVLRRETTHRWSHPVMLYYLVILCSVAACVQGMDETVINGANLIYPNQLGIPQSGPDQSTNEWLLGLISSAPYLCCGVLGCWLNEPLNKYLGRRGTIFVCAFFSFATCIWSACTNSWEHLFVARFFLGIGIGPKSATVPVYAAECAPPAIRGALVMMWQTWTAFGIMLGYVMDLAFFGVKDPSGITGLNWRLMIGSAGIPGFFLMIQVYFCPESPRWLVSKGRYDQAYNSLSRLRHHPIQAARDLYYIHVFVEAEKGITTGRNRFLELFTVPRNRRATQASLIVMFMQQFCGVNAIAYYSSTIFQQSGFSDRSALLASWGFGLINFLFALPAIYTIDTFGRRNLLLTTFPLMSIFLLLTGFAFFIENLTARVGVVAVGIYLYTMVYSPGEGPVPFTYSAECFPLYVRDIGMSLATAVLWIFNFVVALTFPRLLTAFTRQGAFGWYAGWNIVGFILILLFVPETKALTLEELDEVFSVPTKKHAAYQLKALPHNIRKYIFRQKLDPMPPLYNHELVVNGKRHTADQILA